jgi:hypothetical protein
VAPPITEFHPPDARLGKRLQLLGLGDPIVVAVGPNP